MDIAALSIGLHQAQLQNAVGLALTKKVLEANKEQSAALLNMLAPAVPAPHPTLGGRVDVSV